MNTKSRPSLIYLSYFNNFDLTTKVDTPIIGDPISYNNSYPTYTKTTLHCMGMDLPAINIGNTNATHDWEIPGVIPISDLVNVWSVEYFFYIPFIDYSHGIVAMFVNKIKNIGCDPNGWGGGFIGSLSDISNVQAYNGATIIGSGVNGYISLPFNIYNNLCHGAIILNSTTNSVKVYINGDLYCSYVYNLGIPHQAKPFLRSKNRWSGSMTQVAVFNHDRSTNNGMNYPVPTSPYYPIT